MRRYVINAQICNYFAQICNFRAAQLCNRVLRKYVKPGLFSSVVFKKTSDNFFKKQVNNSQAKANWLSIIGSYKVTKRWCSTWACLFFHKHFLYKKHIDNSQGEFTFGNCFLLNKQGMVLNMSTLNFSMSIFYKKRIDNCRSKASWLSVFVKGKQGMVL